MLEVVLPLGMSQVDWVPEVVGIRPARVYVNRPIRVPRLATTDLDAAEEALQESAAHELTDGTTRHGEIRFGCAQDRLVICGMAQGVAGTEDDPWDGPSLELCLTPNAATPARQWFLTLTADGKPGFVALQNDKRLDVPGAEWKVETCSDSIAFVVALPLSQVEMAPGGNECRLEVFLRTREQAGAELRLASLCHSGWSPVKFVRVVLPMGQE